MGAARFPEQISDRRDAAHREQGGQPDPMMEKLRALPSLPIYQKFDGVEGTQIRIPHSQIAKNKKSSKPKKNKPSRRKNLAKSEDEKYNLAARRRNAQTAVDLMIKHIAEDISPRVRSELVNLMYDSIKDRETIAILRNTVKNLEATQSR